MAISVQIDGTVVELPGAVTVAAAIAIAGIDRFRTGVVTAAPRGPVCGMGVCFECRVTVDGVPHVRACVTTCRPGMEIVTGG